LGTSARPKRPFSEQEWLAWAQGAPRADREEDVLMTEQAKTLETQIHWACAAGSVAVSLLLILASWHSAVAQSQMQGPVADRPAPEPAPRTSAKSRVILPSYPVRPLDMQLTAPRWRRDGWGLVVSMGGRSIDPSSPDSGAFESGARDGDLQAGLAWQRGDVSTVVGYTAYDQGRPLAPAGVSGRPHTSRGVLGLSTRIRLP
jgi:hypothetical protein